MNSWERGEVEERYNPTCTNRTSSFFVSCSVTEREREKFRFNLNLRSSDVIVPKQTIKQESVKNKEEIIVGRGFEEIAINPR